MAYTVLITGASGLLGRAILECFQGDQRFRAVGVAFSRRGPGIVNADLRDAETVNKLVDETKPHFIIHAAAERRPDVVERDMAMSERINVEAVWHLGRAASRVGSGFIYISTDYLWDGTAAPYKEDAKPCPLNAYGVTKLRGEYAALAAHAEAIVLRVPVLFGPTADLKESAVTMFAHMILDTSKTHVSNAILNRVACSRNVYDNVSLMQTVDDWQIRVPTFTPDIAQTLCNIVTAKMTVSSPQIAGVYHYSSSDRFTRWGLVQQFAALIRGSADGVPTSIAHISHSATPLPGAPRPFDCMLDCSKLVALGLAAPCTPFSVAASSVLQGAGVALALSTKSTS